MHGSHPFRWKAVHYHTPRTAKKQPESGKTPGKRREKTGEALGLPGSETLSEGPGTGSVQLIVSRSILAAVDDFLRNLLGRHRNALGSDVDTADGVEEEKGDELRKEVYQILKNEPRINFVGNMEGRNLLKGDVDLVVCDGFSGNVMCKTVEGTAIEMFKMIKKDIFSSLKYKIGALFLKKMFAKEKAFLDYQNYGGSVVLGASKVIVKGHGSSNRTAFAKCIEQAYMMETGNLNTELEKIFSDEKPENQALNT